LDDPGAQADFGVAFLGALLIGSLAVFGLEQLDQSFRSSEQIGLPTQGLVPAVLGEAVRSLRTAMLLTSMGAPTKTVLLTPSTQARARPRWRCASPGSCPPFAAEKGPRLSRPWTGWVLLLVPPASLPTTSNPALSYLR
jgi:hypothetical protein